MGFSDLSPKRALQLDIMADLLQVDKSFSDLSPKRALQHKGKHKSLIFASFLQYFPVAIWPYYALTRKIRLHGRRSSNRATLPSVRCDA